MLQHAFLIMVHKSPELLSRIVHILAKPNHHFFIHIDKKTKDFEQYERIIADVQNVTFINRISIFHGAVSQIYCELNLYRTAMNSSVKMDYFHLISGQDYPLRSNEQFDEFFDENIGRSFAAIESQAYHDSCMKRKYPLRTDVYYPNGNSLLGRIFRKLTTDIQLNLHIRPCLTGTWGGWNWRSLYRPVVEYLLEYIGENPKFIKRFNHTSCCDEIYFNTLFHPIMDAMKIDGKLPLRYVSWNPTHPVEDKYRPYTLDERDYPFIMQSQAFFARKVDLPQSRILLDMIDEQRGKSFDFDQATPVL